MLFNSLEFLLFLPTVFALYWFVFRSLRWQNLFLVAASYLFYGWWSWHFLILIAITSLCSYLSGVLIEQTQQSKTRFPWDKCVLATNILINLGILCFYKYYNFFVENFVFALNSIGLHLNFTLLQVILPVGISFYTFQALSYSIDVYRRKMKPTNDIVAFFAFLSFFPQLVAGPIERATNLLPQMLKPRRFDHTKAVDGCRQILWGFFKKVVIADQCALGVNAIFENYQEQGGINLLLGGILFTFQIYGDFSGYSDIAIGTARLFGIDLMRNFNYPYFSRDIAEFWRRWHISLTTWFRDYIYFPLGGSRCSKWKTMRNTLIIFLVSGLWHGANWTFVVWGAYHAALFFPLLLLGTNRKYTNVVAEGRLLPSLREAGQMLFTFLLAVIGWIIFRAENITQAWNYLTRMCTNLSFMGNRGSLFSYGFITIMLFFEWFNRTEQFGLAVTKEKSLLQKRWIRYTVYAFLTACIILHCGTHSDFIYFQF